MTDSVNTSPWFPTFIDVEREFTNFASTFNGGQRVENLVGKLPAGTLNADYFFPKDQVIVELKCLEKDKDEDGIIARRLANSYRHFGYTGSDLMGYLWRGEKMPERVAKRYNQLVARPIIQAIQKANKQIRSTKSLLNTPNARGLTLLANNQKTDLGPQQIISIIASAFKSLSDCHTDCVVYFTPNIYHDMGDNIAHTVWIPIYNVGSEHFGDFVNVLGKAWGDFNEKLGTPYVSREIGDTEDLRKRVMNSKPIPSLRRD